MRRASTQLRRELLGRVAAAAEFGLQPRQIGRAPTVLNRNLVGIEELCKKCFDRERFLL